MRPRMWGTPQRPSLSLPRPLPFRAAFGRPFSLCATESVCATTVRQTRPNQIPGIPDLPAYQTCRHTGQTGQTGQSGRTGQTGQTGQTGKYAPAAGLPWTTGCTGKPRSGPHEMRCRIRAYYNDWTARRHHASAYGDTPDTDRAVMSTPIGPIRPVPCPDRTRPDRPCTSGSIWPTCPPRRAIRSDRRACVDRPRRHRSNPCRALRMSPHAPHLAANAHKFFPAKPRRTPIRHSMHKKTRFPPPFPLAFSRGSG